MVSDSQFPSDSANKQGSRKKPHPHPEVVTKGSILIPHWDLPQSLWHQVVLGGERSLHVGLGRKEAGGRRKREGESSRADFDSCSSLVPRAPPAWE